MNPSTQYRKLPVVINATQWHKNGDHPQDYVGDCTDPVSGVVHTSRLRRAEGWEGSVVRRFRDPNVPGSVMCVICDAKAHDHGWIDTLEGGHRVCPGDWIITGVHGERYPCKPEIFAKTYEKVA